VVDDVALDVDRVGRHREGADLADLLRMAQELGDEQAHDEESLGLDG
jgi:hypothetical protein